MKISNLISAILTKIFFPSFISNLDKKNNLIVTKDGLTSPQLLKSTQKYNEAIKAYMLKYYFDPKYSEIVRDFGRLRNSDGKEMSDDDIMEWKKLYNSLTPEEKEYWKKQKIKW